MSYPRQVGHGNRKTGRALGAVLYVLAGTILFVHPHQMGELPAGMATPVVAFELARTPQEVERMFGPAGSFERATWSAAMARGTWLDFLFLLTYGAFLAWTAYLFSRAHALAKLAAALACATAAFDVLENRELLLVLANLGGEYREPLARLVWFTWTKWFALGMYFVVMAPILWQAHGWFRAATVSGLIGTLAALGALATRGVCAEAMAVGLTGGVALLVVGVWRMQTASPEAA